MNRVLPGVRKALLYEWQRRSTAIFTGLFLYPFVAWFAAEQGFWLSSTTAIVKTTLALMVVTELLPRIRRLSLAALQLLLVVVVTAAASGLFQGVAPETFDPYAAVPDQAAIVRWLDHITAYLAQLHPLIWFSTGTWLVYSFTLWWVQRKSRIFVLVVAGVFLVAVRDSYSQLFLWKNAALIIFSGLCLAVVRHFADLRRERPAVWKHFAISPFPLAFFISVLLLVTMGLGMLAPNVNNLLKDPYTLYQEWKGEQVIPTGKLTNKGPASGKSGNSSSGYSRDDSQLGGSFVFDYTPVMTVYSSQRGYWRGETRALYNGQGWEKSPEEQKNALLGPVSPDKELPQEPMLKGQQPPKSVEVQQSFTMLRNEGFPVLFGAYSVSSVKSVNGKTDAFDSLMWSGLSGELSWTKGSKDYPQAYTVVSRMPVIDEDALEQTALTSEERSLLRDYLQLPETLPARVGDLAKEITVGASDDYDKAKLLQQYLQTNYSYTNTPNGNGADDKDFVDRFLFEIKEGYCDYFSTAMAVMARSVGIPARWVKGYASGTLPDQDSGLVPDLTGLQGNTGGIYTVRNSDAHSWVELYFSGWGWVPFEATAGFTAPAPNVPGEPSQPPASAETPNQASESPAAQPEQSSGVWMWAFWIVLALAAAVAIVYIIRRWGQELYSMLFRRRYNKLGWNQKIVWEYNMLLRAFRRKGMPAFEHETARETVRRWGVKDRWMTADLEQLLQLFEKAKYSPAAVTPEEAARTSLIVRKLRKEI